MHLGRLRALRPVAERQDGGQVQQRVPFFERVDDHDVEAPVPGELQRLVSAGSGQRDAGTRPSLMGREQRRHDAGVVGTALPTSTALIAWYVTPTRDASSVGDMWASTRATLSRIS